MAPLLTGLVHDQISRKLKKRTQSIFLQQKNQIDSALIKISSIPFFSSEESRANIIKDLVSLKENLIYKDSQTLTNKIQEILTSYECEESDS